MSATEDACWSELLEKFLEYGFDGHELSVDGERPHTHQLLVDCCFRHGSRFITSQHTKELEAGSYVIAVAGPDTGASKRLADSGLSVGRDSTGLSSSLRIDDSTLSAHHMTLRTRRRDAAGAQPAAADGLVVEDNNSTNGTLLEGAPVAESVVASARSYIAAGSTTLSVLEVAPDEIAPATSARGPSEPLQRRFREARAPLPKQLRHPTPPRKESEANKRSLMTMLMPVISSVGMALMMMVVFTSTDRGDVMGIPVAFLYVAVIAIGPLFMAFDGVRRRSKESRERLKDKADYQADLKRFVAELTAARKDERDRDRWTAIPAGLGALLAQVRHERLWERSVADEDFCEISVGLHDRPSTIRVEGRQPSERLPFDTQWSMVLRHSLIGEGPMAVLGSVPRARALGRALLLDLAASHSPNDVRIWLITDAEQEAASDWDGARWLPHTFMGDSQNSVFSTPASRAAAFTALKSIVNERASAERREGPSLPVHIVLVDCVAALEPEELTDLIVDGAPVGVVGVILDAKVTPEGTRAQLTLGKYVDEATFVSETQPRANRVRSFEMTTDTFEAAARALAQFRPAGSTRDAPGESTLIRLVDLIDAQTDPGGVDRVIERWSQGGTSRVRVGGLGDHITEIDIMKDGPHGLVGGTTRSGKTEFLKSLIVSLAAANHPDDLSIVIVDFKGGVDHELSARLPHVIDLSTNHDVDSFVRTVQLIEAEMRRRQEEFKKVGAPNHDAYRAARRARPSVPPIPRLLVIVDEFSELLSSDAGKANLSSLESVTRVGGGLGVHLLLVTQNFENQLPSQIAANAGLRICFRVQEPVHSKAVLDSPEAASIPKERIGRAFLRSHGGRAVEFQAARVAGPRPGREYATEPVEIRIVPFESLPDAPPEPPVVDVPAEDTDMYAVVEVIRLAASHSGWTAPAVPWPAELPRDLGLDDLDEVGPLWPVGVRDEPERQRQVTVAFEPYGPNMLLIGGAEARLGEVARAVVASAAARHSPEEMHFYIIDTQGQGLGALRGLPHVGAVAERNEPLAMRILRHVASEVAMRKSALSDMGLSSVQELVTVAAETMPDTVLVVNGADRLLMSGEMEPSPLLSPLTALVSETAGTGVRVLLTGSPSVAHQRLGASVGRRFVLRCPDPNDYSGLGVPRALQSALDAPRRAVDVESGHLMQFALVPSTPDAPPGEVVRALGARLTERWRELEHSALMPTVLKDLPWPLSIREVLASPPPDSVPNPVALCVSTDTGDPSWLDAEEDGPAFFVCGSTKSGRSSALISAATLMARHGWRVLGLPLSRRSPVAEAFPGKVVSPEGIASEADSRDPVALFIDDTHRWDEDAESVRALLGGPGRRAVIAAGPTEFFNGRNDLLRALPARCALVLAPSSSLDASQFGVRRLSDEALRDRRPGMGVLVVAGELFRVQVPFVSAAGTEAPRGRRRSSRSALGEDERQATAGQSNGA
ncbi:MAG: FtsK/SpoIIIE domain-containing protein [Acidimicrobiaceae bacterium]|nr:FtsK/SpoIIIE domain-containing protein [Acidimicrobiaceae bacterium]